MPPYWPGKDGPLFLFTQVERQVQEKASQHRYSLRYCIKTWLNITLSYYSVVTYYANVLLYLLRCSVIVNDALVL